jgi:hypothetical protein
MAFAFNHPLTIQFVDGAFDAEGFYFFGETTSRFRHVAQ